MTSVSVKDLALNFGTVEVLKTLNLDVGRGRVPRAARPVGLRQVHAAQLHRRPARRLRRPDLHQRQERHLGGAEGPRHRHGVPVLCALSADDGRGEPVLRPARSRACRRTRSTSASRAPPRSCRSSRCSSASPSQLSGGQRQRVAIGRALVRDVDVFLFDEPLSNLDAKLRSELRVEIKRLHQRLANTMIYVTHDQIEAMTLADRIAVMKGGVIQQLDTPQAIYNRPVNRFVAGFIGSPGMNFIEGELDDGSAPASRAERRRRAARPLRVRQRRRTAGGAVLGVRPEHIAARRAAQGAAVLAGGRDRDRRADGRRHPGLDQARRPELRLPRRGREAACTSASAS